MSLTYASCFDFRPLNEVGNSGVGPALAIGSGGFIKAGFLPVCENGRTFPVLRVSSPVASSGGRLGFFKIGPNDGIIDTVGVSVIAMRIRPTRIAGNSILLSSNISGSGLLIQVDGSKQLQIVDPAATLLATESGQSLIEDEWNDVLLRYQGNATSAICQLFVNGVKVIDYSGPSTTNDSGQQFQPGNLGGTVEWEFFLCWYEDDGVGLNKVGDGDRLFMESITPKANGSFTDFTPGLAEDAFETVNGVFGRDTARKIVSPSNAPSKCSFLLEDMVRESPTEIYGVGVVSMGVRGGGTAPIVDFFVTDGTTTETGNTLGGSFTTVDSESGWRGHFFESFDGNPITKEVLETLEFGLEVTNSVAATQSIESFYGFVIGKE